MPVNRAKFHFDNTYAGMDMLYGPYVLYQIGDLSCEAELGLFFIIKESSINGHPLSPKRKGD